LGAYDHLNDLATKIYVATLRLGILFLEQLYPFAPPPSSAGLAPDHTGSILILSAHVGIYFQTNLFSARFPAKTFYTLTKPMGATGPTYLNLSFIVLTKEAASHSGKLVITYNST